jgi:hypothetical protein
MPSIVCKITCAPKQEIQEHFAQKCVCIPVHTREGVPYFCSISRTITNNRFAVSHTFKTKAILKGKRSYSITSITA